MSGYDKSKFLNLTKTFEEEFTCGICLNILNNPMTTPCCRLSYCRQCITRWIRTSSNTNTCPNDRQTLFVENLIQCSRIVTNILDKQDVYCDNRPNGCPKVVQLSQLARHLLECTYTHDHQADRDQDTSGPNSDYYKNKCIESAKAAKYPQILDCQMSSHLIEAVIMKSKEAIRDCNDYDSIATYLMDGLENDTYNWVVFVYPSDSTAYYRSVNNSNIKIALKFGELCVLLISELSDDPNDSWTDVEPI